MVQEVTKKLLEMQVSSPQYQASVILNEDF